MPHYNKSQWVERDRYEFRQLPIDIKTEIVRLAFSDKGLNINSDWQYERNSSLIPYTCSKGHKHTISYANFSKGVGCAYCSKRPPKTSEMIRLEFAEAGFTIKNGWHYQNASALIPFTCMSGHSHVLTYNKFQQGQRCMYCVGTPKHNAEDVRDMFFSQGLLIPNDWTYVDSNTPIPFTCTKGHSHQISYSNLKQGGGCIYCYCESRPSDLDKRTKKYGVQRIVQRILETASGKHYNRSILSKWVRANIAEKVFLLYIQNSTIKTNIDHVIPLSWFNLAEEIELKAAWDICNLQTLPIVENKKKGNKLTDSQLQALSEAQKSILNLASFKPEYAKL